MLLARSFWLKAFVTTIAAGLFIRLYEVTIPDSKFSMLPLAFNLAADAPARPSPGVKLTFAATAYCKGLITTAGVPAQPGILASDTSVLPLGTVVELTFRLPGSPTEITAAGRVSWSDRRVGMGVQFERLTPDAQRLLGALVEHT